MIKNMEAFTLPQFQNDSAKLLKTGKELLVIPSLKCLRQKNLKFEASPGPYIMGLVSINEYIPPEI